MPAPSQPPAIDAVFGMARELLGSLMPEEAYEYRMWLREVRKRVRHRQLREGILVRPKQAPHRCSTCRATGHNRVSCPQRRKTET
jgi:hypothetical protein